MTLVQQRIEGPVGTLVLDHDAKRNILSEALTEAMFHALEDFRARRMRVVILRAKPGVKIWSAGHDVRELPLTRRDPLAWNDPLRRIIRQITEFPAPIIAQIEGSVWGGGCELAVSCDITVATPEVTFAITPAKLGIPYNMTGLLNFMNAVPLPLLKEMAFSAQPVAADRLRDAFVLNHVVPVGEIDAFVRDLAFKIAANAPLSVTAMKESMRILASAHTIPPEGFERLQNLRRQVWDSHDYQEGLGAFLEKRKPDFIGA
ncbi:MAG: methylmalonyl-CoA decarboxylase [Rhodospirillaceae bacterium]